MKIWKSKESNKCCQSAYHPTAFHIAEQLKRQDSIQILGSGCKKCHALECSVKDALLELHLDWKIEHITDFAQIAAFGVMTTPALVINEKIVSYGKVLTKQEVLDLLVENLHT